MIDPGAGQQCSKSEAQLQWPSVGAALEDGSVRGGPGGVVADDSLTKDDLAPNSVESSELADGSVDTGALGADAVTAAKVLNGEIGTDELAGDAVTSGKILDGEVATGDLAPDAVKTGKIEDGAVGNGDLAGDAVTSDKILDGEVATGDLAPDAVKTGKIEDGAVGNGDLADEAITAAKIVNGEIGTDKLADDAVTSGKIDDGTIVRGDLADGSVTTEKVTANVTTSVAPLTSPGGTDFTRTVTSFGHETTAGHKLLVMGQVQLTCTCGETDSITVRWQVFDNDVPVSQEYRSVLTSDSPTTPGTVSALIPSANAGLRTYQLKVTTASAGDPVNATNDQLAVIDLGR